MKRPGIDEQLLTPSEVAKLFGVDSKTVTRWAKAGKIDAIRTLGGHRRYRASEVYALLHPTDGQAEVTPEQVAAALDEQLGTLNAVRRSTQAARPPRRVPE